MIRRLSALVVLACAFAALTASPASAQQSVNLSLGIFVPRGEESRVPGDVLVLNRDYLLYDFGDLKSASVGAEWVVALGRWLEAGAGISYSNGTIDSVYTGFVDFDTGTEIEQELKLRLVPISFSVRVLPLGQASAFQPYVGGGIAIINWKYSEVGDFIDFSQPPPYPVDPASYVADGTDTGGLFVGGVRFGGKRFTLGGEIRYQGGSGDLPIGDFYGSKIDLGGWTYNFTAGIRFGR